MESQAFPCIISALWSAGDLFSSVYGVTSLKPKGKFIQPFLAFLFSPLFCFIIFLLFFFFPAFFFSSFCFKVFLAFCVDGLHPHSRQLASLLLSSPKHGQLFQGLQVPSLGDGLFQKVPCVTGGAAVHQASLHGWPWW